MAKAKTVVVPTAGETTEVIASDIRRISAGVKALRHGALNDKALILLIQHACGATPDPISQAIVRRVLDGMESLEATYLRKTK